MSIKLTRIVASWLLPTPIEKVLRDQLYDAQRGQIAHAAEVERCAAESKQHQAAVSMYGDRIARLRQQIDAIDNANSQTEPTE